MTPTTSSVLSHYAATLRTAAPQQWEAFVSVFDAYATEITVAVTSAEQNEILNKQGRAQACLHLLKLFRECHTKSQPSPPSA